MKAKHPIRLMVVDDHAAFRRGIIALIESEPGMVVVAQTGDGHEAVALYRGIRPDVVLMDLRLPGFSGVEVILAIRSEFPDGRFIVLTTYDTDEDIFRAMQSGARTFLLKDMDDVVILDAIRTVVAGQDYLPAQVAKRLSERLAREELSQLEMEVLNYLIRGYSNKEIADALHLTEAGVKFRLKGLFVKLHVQDRTEAVVCALRRGIVHLE